MTPKPGRQLWETPQPSVPLWVNALGLVLLLFCFGFGYWLDATARSEPTNPTGPLDVAFAYGGHLHYAPPQIANLIRWGPAVTFLPFVAFIFTLRRTFGPDRPKAPK